jgi:hypothetical protein
MKPLTKGLILLAVVAFYSFLYLATSHPVKCEDYCQKLYGLDTALSKNLIITMLPKDVHMISLVIHFASM